MMILISVTLPVAMTMAVTMVTVAMVTVTMGTAAMWVCMPEGKNAYQVHHKSSNRHNLVRGHKQRIPTDFIPNWIQVLNGYLSFFLAKFSHFCIYIYSHSRSSVPPEIVLMNQLFEIWIHYLLLQPVSNSNRHSWMHNEQWIFEDNSWKIFEWIK